MHELNQKLRAIQKGLSYEERVRLGIALMVLGELGSDKFYQKKETVMRPLIKAGIVRPIPVRWQKEEGWYEPASLEIRNLLVRGTINKMDGYFSLPE